jgi:hypothetical protein
LFSYTSTCFVPSHSQLPALRIVSTDNMAEVLEKSVLGDARPLDDELTSRGASREGAAVATILTPLDAHSDRRLTTKVDLLVRYPEAMLLLLCRPLSLNF